MKRILSFLKGYISENVIDTKLTDKNCLKDAFNNEDCFDKVPNVPGIYIMVARKAKFQYPKGPSKGLSPVFYIGTSKHLRSRLKEHLSRYRSAKTDFWEHSSWHYSRYNYAVAFDSDIYYMRITGCEKEKALESKAIEGFFDIYGAIPVGNGAISFRP